MKRLLAILLLAGATLFTAAPAMAGNNGHHNHNHGGNYNGYRSGYGYRSYPYGIVTGYGVPYYGGYYGGGYYSNYPVYGNPAYSFANPAAFGYGPAAVQSMFGY